MNELSLFVLLPTLGLLCSVLLARAPRLLRSIAWIISALSSATSAKLLWFYESPMQLLVGGWPQGIAIELYADRLSLLFLVTSLVIAFSCLAHFDDTRTSVGQIRLRYGGFFGLILGVSGALLTRDLFNMFVFFEVFLTASYLLAIDLESRDKLKKLLHYIYVNLFASVLFLIGVGFIYRLTGSVNMAAITTIAPQVDPHLLRLASVFILLTFLMKAAVFPMGAWLVDLYPEQTPAIGALFAGLLTKVGVYAMIRVFGLTLIPDPLLMLLVLILATVMMVLGVLGALKSETPSTILSYHVLSQVGYIVAVFSLGAFGDETAKSFAIAAAVFYSIHHMFVKANLFLVGGMITKIQHTADLSKMRSLLKPYPWLALAFAIPALSLSGLPPFSGFWAKLLFLKASIEVQMWWVFGFGIFASLLTLMSMLKIWKAGFWGESAPLKSSAKIRMGEWVGVLILCLATLLISFYPQKLLEWAQP